MSILAVRQIDKISEGDFTDVPVIGTGDGGKVVKVKGDETGFEYVTGGGGGGAELDVENTFTAAQTIAIPEPAGTVGDEYLANGSFATDLTGWDDLDGAFDVDGGGGLIRATGSGNAEVTQAFFLGGNRDIRYTLNVTGQTAGTVDFYTNELSGSAYSYVGDQKLVDYERITTGQYITVIINASDDFDGVVTVQLERYTFAQDPILTVGTEPGSIRGEDALVVTTDGTVTVGTLAAATIGSDVARFGDVAIDNTVTLNQMVSDTVTTTNTITNSLRIEQSPTAETITCDSTIIISVSGVDYKIPCVAA